MRLDQELVQRGLCESRTEAQELIESGLVLVNGAVSQKQIRKVNDSDALEVTGRRAFVSRGGKKLCGVLRDVYGDDSAIRKKAEGKSAIDIGSSTGGFTDCLLSYGVAQVDAVDVGTDQLHSKLRDDERVSLFENTDIRAFDTDRKYDIVVADLSFISLDGVLDTIMSLGKPGAEYFLLLKPQFEVGRGNTRKGIVKDMEMVVEVLKKYEVLAKMKGLHSAVIYPCHIQGGDGNQEFFLVGTRKQDAQ